MAGEPNFRGLEGLEGVSLDPSAEFPTDDEMLQYLHASAGTNEQHINGMANYLPAPNDGPASSLENPANQYPQVNETAGQSLSQQNGVTIDQAHHETQKSISALVRTSKQLAAQTKWAANTGIARHNQLVKLIKEKDKNSQFFLATINDIHKTNNERADNRQTEFYKMIDNFQGRHEESQKNIHAYHEKQQKTMQAHHEEQQKSMLFVILILAVSVLVAIVAFFLSRRS
ncbi:hypothetical protein F5Y04DRAFT_284784 [Hypomontagnella monticulosa]|nr:hypothetical protein F5Y04DRAFT_284784 [Hypomontagnella monticulosa]